MLAGRPVLTDVSFAVPKGGRLTLIGPNGSGKTTVLNVVSGIVEAQRGRISLQDEDITTSAPYNRARRGLRRTFQSAHLFPDLTVAEALQLGSCDWKAGEQEIGRGLPTAPEPAAISASLGIEALLAHKIGVLSFGQRKLVGLAMALTIPAAVLLLDEPVTGLAPATVQKVLEVLLSLASALVVVEHNLDVVRALGGRTTVLSAGKVVTSGDTQDVLSSRELRAAYR
jgi:ABC-type branched-subunit amino acid transport system ATPase component